VEVAMAQRRAVRVLAAALIMLACMVVAKHASAACRTTSHIPSLSVMTVRNAATGQTIWLRSGVFQSRRTVFIWINGRLLGQYYVPVTIFTGEVAVQMRLEWRYETWLGKVRLVQKEVPYLVACGNWFF
jgi:hypothetical protein